MDIPALVMAIQISATLSDTIHTGILHSIAHIITALIITTTTIISIARILITDIQDGGTPHITAHTMVDTHIMEVAGTLRLPITIIMLPSRGEEAIVHLQGIIQVLPIQRLPEAEGLLQ